MQLMTQAAKIGKNMSRISLTLLKKKVCKLQDNYHKKMVDTFLKKARITDNIIIIIIIILILVIINIICII